MRRIWVVLVGAVMLLLLPLARAETPPVYLEKDLLELGEMISGVWDNDRQVFFADEAGFAAETLAPRQTIEIVPIEMEGAPEGLVLRRAARTVEGEGTFEIVHAFDLVPGESVIRHRFMKVPAEGGAELTPVADCEIRWMRRAGGFQGRSADPGCAVLFPRPEGEAALSVTLTLTETDFTVESQRGAERVEARLRRARAFSCWVAVMRGAAHGDSGEGMSDWDFRRDVMMHDQGGEAVITTDETPPRTVRLKLRDVDWPYGTRRPSLTLYAYEGESDRAVSYAWTGGGEDRIGLNLRWLQASCTRVGVED